jgi:LacI family transcriptional regulator
VALQHYFEAFGQPDGILAGHDQMGIATLKFARRKGIDVPSSLKVTGFNAFEFWNYSDPLLTTIKAPTYELGWRGGQHLLNRLQTGVFVRREIVLPVALQLGGST